MTAQEHGLITLHSSEIELGVLPPLAGRAVHLRYRDGPNLLFAPEAGWQAWPETRPSLDDPPRWVPYNGHITWIGPQSDWWNHQDIHPHLRGEPWPPDPYVEFAPFEVVHHGPNRVELAGPVSPYTGLSLRKEYLVENAKVHVSVEATNQRQEPVKWDLWSNTRIRPDIPAFAPAADEADWWVKDINAGGVPNSSAADVFSFDPESPPRPAASKAFIHAHPAEIAAMFEDCTWIKRTILHPRELYHPEHAPVEIYLDTDPNQALQELEFHSPWRLLKPGETMRLTEQWILQQPGSAGLPDWLPPDRGRAG